MIQDRFAGEREANFCDQHDIVSVKFRRYHAHPKEDNARTAPIWRRRVKNTNDLTAGVSLEDEKNYSVDLSPLGSVGSAYYGRSNVEVTALSPRKAIVRALHKSRVCKFPDNWLSAKVTEL